MSSSSRRTGMDGAVPASLSTSVVVLGGPGWVQVRRRQIRERGRRRSGRSVDAVADGWAVARVDELGEDRVDHVVVERPAPTGSVRLTSTSGELDLEERAL